MLLFKIIALLFTFVICADSHPQSSRSDVNYDNLRRFMNQSPENLAKTLQLLENPYIAAALVKSNRTPEFGGSTEKTLSTAEAPREETNKLLDFLLTQRSSPTYRIRKPAISLVPPEVDTRGILNDPLLGSFFQNTKEDLPPLENAKNIDIVPAPSASTSTPSFQQFRAIEITTPSPQPQPQQPQSRYFYDPFVYYSQVPIVGSTYFS